ncbi:hypothetical protein FACS189464_1660 [Bacteroidia bacterium]|nr:hypothetical protein FACS189464_1660 [Bacteroidia bacterium]
MTEQFNGIYGNAAEYENDLRQVANSSDLEGLGDLGKGFFSKAKKSIAKMKVKRNATDPDETAIYNFSVRASRVIKAKPENFKNLKSPQEVARMLDYIVDNFNTPMRAVAIGIVDSEIERLQSEGALPSAPEGDLEGLGSIFSNIVDKAKSLVQKITGGSSSATTTTTPTTPTTIGVPNPNAIPASSSVKVTPMTGGMMDNIGAFFKKNALIMGVGAVGIAAAIYFITRKKKKS